MRGLLVAFFLLGSLAPASALAQQSPPGRVGRVSLAEGPLAFLAKGERRWSSAGLNYPVATGTAFWTAPEARAGMEVGPDTLYLAPRTELDVSNLDRDVMRLGVPRGRIYLHIREIGEERVEIDLPSGEIWILAPGEYGIAAGSREAPAEITVYYGRARFVGPGLDIPIEAGEMAEIGGYPLSYAFARARSDAFLAWARAHDYGAGRIFSVRYVSSHMTGYEALDRYGRWIANPEYGAVWFPDAVPAGWIPYTYGHWIWVAPWGWTWIDEEPWGFAPFHYGRWVLVGRRWGWVPGSYTPYPVYAPALVAFLSVSRTFGTGPVGWFPLAPGEAYWPSYTTNIAYIRNLNRPVVRDVARLRLGPNRRPPRSVFGGRFVNRRFAVVVPRREFGRARLVRQVRLKLAKTRLLRARVDPRPPRLTPRPRPLPPSLAKAAPPPPRLAVRRGVRTPLRRPPTAPPRPPAAVAPRFGPPRPPAVVAPRFGPPRPPAAAEPRFGPPRPPAVVAPRFGPPRPPAAVAPRFGPPRPPAVTAPRFGPPRPPVVTAPRFGPPRPPTAAQPRFGPPRPPTAAQPRFGPPRPPAAPAHRPPAPAFHTPPRMPAPRSHPPAAASRPHGGGRHPSGPKKEKKKQD